MKKVVERERNKNYYRVLHLPIWIWVFFILPGHLTYELYLHGPARAHGWWLAGVILVCAWRGWRGRLPGVEPRPYITHYGIDQPNLAYRVVCYTAAWIDILTPFALNLVGLVIASLTGRWILQQLYAWLYYPLAAAVVLATFLDWTPRARRSTIGEGAEKGWFYVGIWTVVPAQVAIWGAWRLGGRLGLEPLLLSRFRFSVFLAVAGIFFLMGLKGKLPRTQRYHYSLKPAGAAAPLAGRE
jgi:hypothetical protein